MAYVCTWESHDGLLHLWDSALVSAARHRQAFGHTRLTPGVALPDSYFLGCLYSVTAALDPGQPCTVLVTWVIQTTYYVAGAKIRIHKFRLWRHWLANAARDSNTGQTIANFRTSYSRMDWRNKKHVRTKLFRDKTCVFEDLPTMRLSAALR